jgi:hypothetical protein
MPATYTGFTFPDTAGTGFITNYTIWFDYIAGWGTTGLTPLAVTTTSLPDGAVGVLYSQPLQATGGNGSYTWSITSGSLPAGLTLTPSSGLISGTPTTAATSPFTAQVFDGSTNVSQPLSITVTATVSSQKLVGADDSTPTGITSSNYFVLDRFIATQTGTMSNIRIKCGASGNVKVAVYTDTSSQPTSLLSAVNSSTPVSTGWNVINLNTPVSVTSGTAYWLAFIMDIPCVNFKQEGTTTRWFMPATYTGFTFPDTAGTGFITNYTIWFDYIAGWGSSTPPIPPDPPTIVSPGAAITFKWNASTGATTYWLQVNTASDFTGTNALNAEVGNVTTQEVTGLSLGTIYYWRVRAGNSAGWGNWSSIRSVVSSTVP